MATTMIAPNRKVVAGTLQQMGTAVYDGALYQNDFLVSVGNTILGNTALENTFFSSLVNRIGKIYLNSKNYVNTLAHFKKGEMPMGTSVQEIYVNPVEAKDYTVESTLMSDKANDNILSVFYFMNSTKKFLAETSYQAFTQAFNSWAEMDNFINSILNNLYNSQQIYEWNRTKQMLGNDFNESVSCGKKMAIEYNDATFSQDFAKLIKSLSLSFKCPSAKFNNFRAYAAANGYTNITPDPITTFSNADSLNLIIRNEVMADMDIDVLSVAFNMSKAEFAGKISPVDNFGYINVETKDNKTFKLDSDVGVYDYTDYTITEGGKTYNYKLMAILCDTSFIHIEDTQKATVSEFQDASNLMRKTYLHSWQQYGLCPFANAVYLYTKNEVI